MSLCHLKGHMPQFLLVINSDLIPLSPLLRYGRFLVEKRTFCVVIGRPIGAYNT